jgi:hypothetical protein
VGKFVNVGTGKVVEGGGSVDQLAAHPDWAPVNEDGTVNVTYPNGSVKSVPVADYKKLSDEFGAQAQTFGEQDAARKQAAYGDAPFRTFVEQAVPFNSVLLPTFGVDSEQVAEDAARNPVAGALGEGAQMLATSWAGGGLVRGAEEAIAGTEAIQGLRAGGALARTVAKVAPRALAYGAEGALQNGASEVNHALLENRPITAGRLFGAVGTGALLGAGFGAASAGWESLRAAQKAGKAEADAALAAEETAAAAPAKTPRVKAEAPEVVVPSKAKPPADAVVDDFKTKYNTMTRVSRQNVRQFEGLVARGEVTPELAQAAEALEAARFKTHSMLPLEGNTTGMRSYDVTDPLLGGEGAKGGSYARGQGKIAMEWTADNATIADAARRPGFQEALLEHQAALDHMQELLGNRPYPPVIGSHPIFADSVFVAARGQAKVLPGDAKKLGSLFGVDLTEAPLPREGVPKTPKMEPAEAAVPHASTRGHGINTDTPMGYVKSSAIHHASTGVAHGVASNVAMLLGGTAGAWRVGPMVHHKFQEVFGDGPISHGLSYVAGGLAGIPIALAASFLIRRPMNAALRRLMAGEGLKIGEGVSKALAVGGGKAALARPALVGSLLLARYLGSHKGKGGDAFADAQRNVVAMIQNPEATRARVRASLDGVRDLDPHLADMLEEKALNRIQFYVDSMPKNPGVGSAIDGYGDWKPTDEQVDRWGRLVEVGEDPMSIFPHLAAGTLLPDQVHALATLHPELYGEISGAIQEKLPELQRGLSFDQQNSLSVLFGRPINSLMKPDVVRRLQASHAVQPAAAAPPPRSGGAPKAPQPTQAQRAASR